MSDAERNQKRALRAEFRRRRRVMTVAERENANAALTQNLARLTTELRAGYVSAYLSTPLEPDTRGFLAWAREHGIRVIVPVSREDGLLDWASSGAAQESLDVQGMPIPTSTLLGIQAIHDVDLILIPAASVDHSGMRMGWGRGYFDKTLGSMPHRPPVYAVIFDNEFVDTVPTEIHDESVDGVVTPSGIHRFP